MSRSNQRRTPQALPAWLHLLHYLLGVLVGALPLLLFVCIVFVTFDVLLPHGLRAPALFVYSWVPLSSALVCIGDLVLGIVRWKKSLAFSIGIFTALFLLLLISPGLLTVWALGSDGFVGH